MSKQSIKEGKYVAIPKCYYCNQDKNELLLHKGFGDISNLHQTVSDMEPCDECKKKMEMGVMLVSIRDGESQEGNPPNPYRTGHVWVVKLEAANRMFNVDFTKCIHFAFIEDSVAAEVGLPLEPTKTEEG